MYNESLLSFFLSTFLFIPVERKKGVSKRNIKTLLVFLHVCSGVAGHGLLAWDKDVRVCTFYGSVITALLQYIRRSVEGEQVKLSSFLAPLIPTLSDAVLLSLSL